MKKIGIGIFLLFCIITIIFFMSRSHTTIDTSSPMVSLSAMTDPPTPLSKTQEQTIVYNGTTYAYDFFTTIHPEKLLLIPNFTEKRSGDQIMTEHMCISGVNGGFYTPNNQPLGLFLSGGTTLQKQIMSTLVNGFISFGKTITIGSNPTNETYLLQTGPLLYANQIPLPLAIKNDTHDRRMIAITTTDNTVIFITLYIPDAVFQGPLLGDVPVLLQKIDTEHNFHIQDAINLDGGSASFFSTDSHTISELNLIGSLICLEK
jgi:exopolysaccharide biosynthesis protein